MAIYSIASADSVTITGGTTVEISGTTTINTISGVKDAQTLLIYPTGTWSFGAAGNVVASTVAQVVGTPVLLVQRNGTLYQIGMVGYASTGNGNVVRANSPTIVTPTIASFVNATHTHQDAAGGGQLAAAALSDGTTGTGAFARANSPTIATPVITGSIQLGSIYIETGTGSPEGALARPVGSTFHRTDGGASTTLYVKESGASVTGWVAK